MFGPATDTIHEPKTMKQTTVEISCQTLSNSIIAINIGKYVCREYIPVRGSHVEIQRGDLATNSDTLCCLRILFMIDFSCLSWQRIPHKNPTEILWTTKICYVLTFFCSPALEWQGGPCAVGPHHNHPSSLSTPTHSKHTKSRPTQHHRLPHHTHTTNHLKRWYGNHLF